MLRFRRWWYSPSTWFSDTCKTEAAFKSGSSKTLICESKVRHFALNPWTKSYKIRSCRSHCRIRWVHEPGAGRRRGIQYEEQEPQNDGPDHAEGRQYYPHTECQPHALVIQPADHILSYNSAVPYKNNILLINPASGGTPEWNRSLMFLLRSKFVVCPSHLVRDERCANKHQDKAQSTTVCGSILAWVTSALCLGPQIANVRLN